MAGEHQLITFRFGDLLDPSDPLAWWITAISIAWNDLALTNDRLIRGLENDTADYEHLFDAMSVAASVWEISKYLRESEQQSQEVATAIKALSTELQADYRRALDATDPRNEDTWFKTKLVTARDSASHYPRLGHKSLVTALRKLQDEQGTIEMGNTFIELRAGFADDIASNLFFSC